MSDDSPTPERRTRRLAAVWFADIRGYTALSSSDEDAAMRVVDDFQHLSRHHVGEHGGRVVKFIGDAVLTVFDSTDAALNAALDLREAFAALEIVDTHDLALRVGVHLGEVVEADDGDVYGDGVNTASRVESAAEANQVAVTETVYQQINNRKGFYSWPIGERTLKGIPEPVVLYEVSREAPDPTAIRPPTTIRERKQARVYRRATALGIGASIVAFGILTISIASRPLDVDRNESADPGATESRGHDGGPGATTASRDTAGSLLQESDSHEDAPATSAGSPTSGEAGTPTAEDAGGLAPVSAQPPGPERAAPVSTPAPVPTWDVSGAVDPIDGSSSAALVGHTSTGVVLRIVCSGRSSRLEVVWPSPLTSDEVTLRIDSDQATTSRWVLSQDSTSSTYRGDTRRVLRDWFGASSIAVRGTGRGGSITGVLDAAGLDAGLDELEQSCR